MALAALLLACAHTSGADRAKGAQDAAELFHHRARWRDFGGAALLVVPERRGAFERERRLLGDERDLSIADYELERVTLGADGLSARVVSRISWHRLPSISQHDDTVVTELRWYDGTWLIDGQAGGPFDGDLSDGAPGDTEAPPRKKPPAVSGPAEAADVEGSPMEPPNQLRTGEETASPQRRVLPRN